MSDTDYAANVMHVYRSATHDDIREGMAWYRDAHAIAREAGDIVKGAGIIAALSPRLHWHRNVLLARQAFHAPLTGGALSRSIAGANAIREGAHPLDVLGGNKTRAFFDNILSPLHSDAVTVDTHAIKVAGLDRDSVSDRLYADISDGYREAAAYAGIRPLDMQAVTWVTYKRNPQPRRKGVQ